MNRIYLWGIALGVAVLGIALLGNESRAVASDACALRLVQRLATRASGHVPSQALPCSDLPSEDL